MDEGVAAEKCVCCIHWWCCGWGGVWGWGGVGDSVLGVVLGDLVDVAAWENVPCVSKIDTLDFSTIY
jgi:hypothetical protein